MKQETKQANFRLPEELLIELKEVADRSEVSQTVIVCEAVKEKVSELKLKIQSNNDLALQS